MKKNIILTSVMSILLLSSCGVQILPSPSTSTARPECVHELVYAYSKITKLNNISPSGGVSMDSSTEVLWETPEHESFTIKYSGYMNSLEHSFRKVCKLCGKLFAIDEQMLEEKIEKNAMTSYSSLAKSVYCMTSRYYDKGLFGIETNEDKVFGDIALVYETSSKYYFISNANTAKDSGMSQEYCERTIDVNGTQKKLTLKYIENTKYHFAILSMSKGSLSLKPFLLKAAQPYGTDLPTFTVFHNHKSLSSFSETYAIGKITHINYKENNSFFHSAYSKLGGAVFDYNYNFIGFNVGYQTSDPTKAFAVTAEYIYTMIQANL